jgi:hypothetical protein
MNNPTNLFVFFLIYCISKYMEEPNVDERERAMGFCINITTLFNFLDGVQRGILGQVMELNCFI